MKKEDPKHQIQAPDMKRGFEDFYVTLFLQTFEEGAFLSAYVYIISTTGWKTQLIKLNSYIWQ